MNKLLICFLTFTLMSAVLLSGCKDSSSAKDSELSSVTASVSSSGGTKLENSSVSEKTKVADENIDSSENSSSAAENISAETKMSSSADESIVEYKAADLVGQSKIEENVFSYNDLISFAVPENFEIDRLGKTIKCTAHDNCGSVITFYDSTQTMKVEKRMQYENISENLVKEMVNDSFKKMQSHGADSDGSGEVKSFEKYEINGCKAVKYSIGLDLDKGSTVITSVLIYVGDKLYSIGFTDYNSKHLSDFEKCIDTISVNV